MYTVAQINAMSDEEKAELHRKVARKLALRIAGFAALKVGIALALRSAAKHAYQASTTEH